MGLAACVGKPVLFCNLVANMVLGVASCINYLGSGCAPDSSIPPCVMWGSCFPLCLSFPICKLGTLVLTPVPRCFVNQMTYVLSSLDPSAWGGGDKIY